jgi:L-amino acid N-acyltransferase YncA
VNAIRLATAQDGPAIADIYRPAVTDAAISFEMEPPDGAQMQERVVDTLKRLPWLVCEAGADVVAYAYASAFRNRAAYQWSVEVSAYVREDSRRAGAARALYASLFAVLVLQGYRNALAGITLPNDASVGFHRSVGFTSIGVYRGVGYKHGAWHDVGWYERPLAPRRVDPPPPVTLPQLLGTAEFDRALATGASLVRPPLT